MAVEDQKAKKKGKNSIGLLQKFNCSADIAS